MKSAFWLLSASIRQALPTRRSIGLLILEAAPMVVYLIVTSNRTPTAALQSAAEVATSVYFMLVLPIVAIVVAAGVLGNERRDLTLSFIALRPMPRWVLAATKLLAALVAGYAINIVGAVLLGFAHGLRFGSWGVLGGMLAGALIATIAYAAIFVPLGYLTDRAVVVGIAYLFIFENGVVFLLPGLASLSPWRLGLATTAAVAESVSPLVAEALGSLSPSFGRILLVVAAYTVVSIALTAVLLTRRDLT